jgi:hypothetical protein
MDVKLMVALNVTISIIAATVRIITVSIMLKTVQNKRLLIIIELVKPKV